MPTPTPSPTPAASSARIRLLLILIAAVLVLGGAFAAFHFASRGADGARSSGAKAASATPPTRRTALAVSTVHPQRATWSQQLSVSGGIFPWQEAVIAAETSGLRVVKLAADVGSVVRAGQLLAELSRDSVEASLAQQEANLAKARAAVAEATANGDRARRVKGSGAMSEQLINQYLSAEQSAKASVAAAAAALRSERVRLAQTRIVAPDDGVISSRSATLGSVVQAGNELFRMLRGNRLEWRAEVSAEQLARLAPGQKAQLRLANGAQLDGSIRMLAPTLDPATRKALVYVDLPTDSAARAGMFASGEILTGSTAASVLPSSAVILRDGHSYVFQVGAQDIVRQIKVDTGRRQDGDVEILDPLPTDARIVASGGAFLNDGDAVRVEAAPPPAAGNADAPGAGPAQAAK
ncbi:MAG: efflux RND transporter periplasmic adaptor subunit [Candidatus Accumulibacter sp.]|uniref:efflux RND transporter periplasmic adaptor subunit n=1 Tax=Accumulibacter sp. TaxID=2053492 RepID=UPI001A5DC36F|nr:efflux RND transporter periplasmic adaptor subunit [Accumulibacter sp.]MBL8368796.1 efflux RND transporter periplasmic adaptor subunit [Accumulibacter sp.]HRE87430.1 efflux RND transporter periplasmic adaptor subunit [Accumulibacter sp.]